MHNRGRDTSRKGNFEMKSWLAIILFVWGTENRLVLSLLRNGYYKSTISSRLHHSSLLPTLCLFGSTLDTNRDVTNLDTLRRACETRDVLPDDVVSSINQIERTAKDVKCIDMRGKWELIYSSIIPGGYFPVTEVADFYGYSLTSSFGFLSLGGFEGKSTVVSETNPAVIEFSSNLYKLGPIKINIKDPKVRSYTFLYVDQYFAVARSSSGGGTLMRKST